jgi:hypothetical protein
MMLIGAKIEDLVSVPCSILNGNQNRNAWLKFGLQFPNYKK